VRRIRRSIAALLACGLAAACALAGATAQASDETPPVAQTLAPTAFAGTVIVLHGTVDAGNQRTTYWFEVGPTTAYGAITQPVTIDKNHAVAVASVVSGLLKGATYHARLVARNGDGLSLGADVSFTTAGPNPPANAPAAPPGPGTGAGNASGPNQDSGSDQGTPAAPVLAPPAPPELGHTLGVAPQSGNVLVRLPGSTRAVALNDAASVPVGSIVDTRAGTVKLQSALPGAGTQTGTFHGGRFEVRQPAGARGMTELVLRGPLPTCTGAGSARAATASAKRPPRALWGRDDHGRFRTRGSNSVATVRGTAWYVEDRCDGTLTRVSKGSVSVRDLRRQRTVIVDAGKSYLARSGALTR
jgi:hypothetical protein